MNDSDAKLNEVLQSVIHSLVTKSMKEHFEGNNPSLVFESIEDYNRKTGKRFRITKDQKNRGLNREDAFKELFKKE
jgi:hypothetical protein